MNPIRVTQNQACELLAVGRDALSKLTKTDPTFPKPYKAGNTKQAPVYFDYAELANWHKQQMAACEMQS